jgi:hypothetical protein
MKSMVIKLRLIFKIVFNVETFILDLEDQNARKNGNAEIDDARMKQTLYMLINDLKKMNDFADIHRNPDDVAI